MTATAILFRADRQTHIQISIFTKYSRGPFTLRVKVNGVMLLPIALWLNCLDFLINQASCSKNALQPQLIRYDPNVDVDTPNQSLVLSVNGPYVPYSPIGRPVWSTVAQYSMSTCIFLVLSAQLLNSDSYCRQPMSCRGLWVIPSTLVRYFSGSEPIWVKLYLPAIGQSTGAGGFTVNKEVGIPLALDSWPEATWLDLGAS